MARLKTRFVCQNCGAVAVKWQGRCSDCSEWNTLVEEPDEPRRGALSPVIASGARPTPLADVAMTAEHRFHTGVKEFDRVAGGGLVPGSLLLVGGPPGIGKSTLLLQVAEGVGRGEGAVLYVTGEESLSQVRMRADRLGVATQRLSLLSEIDLEGILATARDARPRLLMVDSVQTLMHPEVSSAPGSVAQVRECTAGLMRLAKSEGITVILVGHVTKDGSLAGPRVMEHLVDTVLYFEGDDAQDYRVLKAVKNRFGPTHEIGLFEMRERGLMDLPNASEFFLSQRVGGASGSCVVPVVEGSRPMLVEVQALCIERSGNKEGAAITPARRTTGIDANRLAVLLAVLQKRGGLGRLSQTDVFVNVAGGIEIDEPAADLAVALAVASSSRDTPVTEGTAILGELGLGGEVRSVSHVEQRVSECARMGFQRVVLPAACVDGRRRGGLQAPAGVKLVGVAMLRDALDACLSRARSSKETEMPEWIETS